MFRLIRSDASIVPSYLMGRVQLLFTHPPAKEWAYIGGKVYPWYRAMARFGTITVVRQDVDDIEQLRDMALQSIVDFTREGDYVVDPFCGESNIGEIALRLGRQFVGIDIDGAAIRKSEVRLRAYA